MEKGMIITLPRYDDTTEYISQWSYKIEETGNQKGIKIKKLKGKEVNKEEFEKVIKKLDYKLLVLNGHGSDKNIFGHNGKVLIGKGINQDLLVERITYSRSCNSALSLGTSSMENNSKGCFIGYNVEFTFYIDETWVTNPLKDKTARLFLSSSNLVPISIIKGNTANEAHEKSKRQMLKNMNKILNKKTKDSLLIASALWNNYFGQVILGNKNARF